MTDSPSAPVAETQSAAITPDANPAASSTVETPAVDRPLVDIVADALKGTEASPTSEDGSEKPETEAAKPGEDAEGDETELDDKLLPAKTQKRIRQLTDSVARERSRADGLESKAREFDEITSFMHTNKIGAQELNNTLQITGMIQTGRYPEALEVLEPIYRELAKRAGKVLPPELTEEVRLGYITEPRARELQESRVRADMAQRREQESERERVERGKVERHNQIVNSNAIAVDEWSKTKAATDPDWTSKQAAIAEQVELEVYRRGFPPSPAEAVAMAEKALASVEASRKQFLPKPQAKRTVTGQYASPRSEAKPTSALEAVELGLSRTG